MRIILLSSCFRNVTKFSVVSFVSVKTTVEVVVLRRIQINFYIIGENRGARETCQVYFAILGHTTLFWKEFVMCAINGVLFLFPRGLVTTPNLWTFKSLAISRLSP